MLRLPLSGGLFFENFSQNLLDRVIPFSGNRVYFYFMQTDEVMDYKGLSAYLKFAQNTLRHKVMLGEIPFFKIGRSVRFSKKDIDAWLAGKRLKTKLNGENSGDLFPAAEALND